MILRRRGLLVSSALLLAPTPDHAAPANRAVTLLLGSQEGSNGDAIGRVFAEFLAQRLNGVELRPTNLPGDAGRTMLAALGDAAPDGATIGWVITPTLPARIIDRGDVSLSQRIQLVGQVEREPVAFVSLPNDPPATIQDIIQRASDDADAVPLGTPPAGSAPHLAALRVQVLAQIRLNIVTFPSAAAARQAVLAGNVSAAALGLADAIGDIRDGNLSAIGIAARRRFGRLPDTPVLDEGGIPLAAFIRRGIGIPLGTPAAMVATLAEAMRAVTEDETFRGQAEASGYYAAWEEGAAWLAKMETEQAALAKLWETDPWLSSSGG